MARCVCGDRQGSGAARVQVRGSAFDGRSAFDAAFMIIALHDAHFIFFFSSSDAFIYPDADIDAFF